ncbi:hypothetical protein FJZ53_03030, partial [Candidatus Woesearchaeota archaeon]|nr:hypothetical protein [Candidatus Woesearchaeota archaeon]
MKKMRGLITIFLVLSFILTALYLSNVVLVQAQQSVVDEEVLNSLDIEGKAKVIVLLKDSDKNIRLRSAKRNTETFSVNGFKKGHGFSLVNGFSGEVTREGLESLKNNPKVERIIFDKVYTVNLAESVPMINASRTHAYQVDGQNLTGAGETICILDTGIDTDHPSFEGKIIGCQTFIDGTTTCEDDHGHGTHVAGIASAKGSVIGVAPGSNIAMMKVCDSGGGCTSSDLLSGIEWCVANKGSLNISVMSM